MNSAGMLQPFYPLPHPPFIKVPSKFISTRNYACLNTPRLIGMGPLGCEKRA